MDSQKQKFILIYYLVAAVFSIVVLVIPFATMTTTVGTTSSTDVYMGIKVIRFAPIAVISAVAIFFVLRKYNRITNFVLSLVSSGYLLLLMLYASGLESAGVEAADILNDVAKNFGSKALPMFKTSVTFEYNIGYYLIPVAAILFAIAGILTFVFVRGDE